MSTNKTVVATKRQQLVDLNGETTNFDLTFTSSSTDGSDFDVLVIDQNTLDSNPTLEFKRTRGGAMSGNIVADKDVYQNYYLCLKSDKDTKVNITINKKEIPPNPNSHMQHNQQQHQHNQQQHNQQQHHNQQQQHNQQQHHNQQQQHNQQQHHNQHQQQQHNQQQQQHNQQNQEQYSNTQQSQHPNMQQQKSTQNRQLDSKSVPNSGRSNKKMLFIVVAIIGGALLLYYLYTRSSKNKDTSNTVTKPGVVIPSSPVLQPSPLPSPSPPVRELFKGNIGNHTFSTATGITNRMANMSMPKRV